MGRAEDIAGDGLGIGLALVGLGLGIVAWRLERKPATATATDPIRGRATQATSVLPHESPTMTTPSKTYGVAQPRSSDVTDPSVARWASVFAAPAVAAGVPLPFVLAWTAIESDGDEGSIGQPGAKGPDGYPKEVGLLQLYNPDDFQSLGFSPAQLLNAAPADKAQKYLAFVLLKKRTADHVLANAHIAWPVSSPDYWAAVKLEHASVAYPPTMYAQVTAKLGRPPNSWREFRSTYETFNPAAKYNPTLKPDEQNYFFRILDNAEWTGYHVAPAQPAVS
jgi:hypothetical protein